MAYQRSLEVEAIMSKLQKRSTLKGFLNDEECVALTRMVIETLDKNIRADDEDKLQGYLRLDRAFTVPEGDRICDIAYRYKKRKTKT